MNALRQFREARPRAWAVAVAGASLLALLLFTQLFFPGDPGPGRGTPAAILFRGLVLGTITSLFAVGIVLVYRTMRFINFAQGSFGTITSVLMGFMLVFTPLPFAVAFPLALVVSGAMGLIAGVFLLRFFNSSRLFLTVVTIVGQGFLAGSVVTFIARLPFWPSPDDVTTAEQNDLANPGDLLPFPGWEFEVGDFPLPFGFAEVFALEVAVVALLGVGFFLRYTRAGTAVRAMAENPERASLLGISVGTLSVIVWVIAAVLDGAAGYAAAIAARDVGLGFTALLIPLAAAVIGRFRSIGTTVFASVVLGVLRLSYLHSFESSAALFDAILFVFVAAGLLFQRKSFGRSESGAAVSWSATDEPRPIPNELRSITALRLARWGLMALGAVVILVAPFLLSTQRVFLGSQIFIMAIAVLSLVVLTGWAGQVSLGQWGLVAVGSVVGGALTAGVGISFWFAVPITVAITAAVAVLVGLPALRIRGLYLLVITFAFAVMANSVLFDERYFGWLLPDEAVERPKFFFVDFEPEKSMYYLALGSLVVAVVLVRNLRKSRVGRLLISARENESNLQSFGVNLVRAKLLAFAIAGALAGFSGVLFAHQQRGIAADSFGPDQSIQIFIQAVVGGVSSPGGALLGSAYFNLVQEFARTQVILQTILQGVAPLMLLFVAPGGLISIVNSTRDGILRIIAQRRRIVVPSLFADYDPEVAERQLIPFAVQSTLTGLAVLPPVRYTLSSELYKGKGERIIDRLMPARQSRDTAALAAAAAAADEAERERELGDGRAERTGEGDDE